MEKLANLLKAIEYQPTLTIGDFNFDSKGTQSKDVKWQIFLEQNNFKEKETTINSYIRRYNNNNQSRTTTTRPDHLFYSSHFEITDEQALPLLH